MSYTSSFSCWLQFSSSHQGPSDPIKGPSKRADNSIAQAIEQSYEFSSVNSSLQSPNAKDVADSSPYLTHFLPSFLRALSTASLRQQPPL
jgi:hypothetical protein